MQIRNKFFYITKTKIKFKDLVKEMVSEDLKTVELEQETRRFGIDG